MESRNSTFFQPPAAFSSYAADGYMSDYDKRCIIVPVIGNLPEETLANSSLYICMDT
jgi:hypothetical protein